MKHIQKPAVGEYMPYAIAYIDLLPDNSNIVACLQSQCNDVCGLINSLSEEHVTYRYAEGKWNIKEVLVHIMDTERIFAYRALRIARNDLTPLAGFDQDDYVPASRAAGREIQSIMKEYNAVRQGSITLLDSLREEDLLKHGIANAHAISVRALAYQLAGHELHHLRIIRERYLAK